MILAIFVTTLCFLLYIQYSPGMGNIWYRNNEYFSPIGAIHVMIYPFQTVQMWYPAMWDINYIVWIIFAIIVSLLIPLLSAKARALFVQ